MDIGNLSRETGIAFARSCARLSETAVAFARAGRASTETAIAFAGEKWAFWVRFSVAEVMVVSMVAVWGRAVVMVVSRWSASAVTEVSLVSTSSRHSCLCAKKFALLGPMVGVIAKEFAQRTKNGPQSALYGVLGEFFRGLSGGVGLLGELCRVYRHGRYVSQVRWRPTCRKWWGFCTTRSPLATCRRRVGASCRAIPPIGV